MWDPSKVEDVNIRTAQNSLREDVKPLATEPLLQSIAHSDIRIRQRAHLELARRGMKTPKALVDVAMHADGAQTPRLDSLWALGVQSRRTAAGARNADADAAVVQLLADEDVEMRRLPARLAVDARIPAAGTKLTELLTDEDLRVRAQAAIALGKLGFAEALPNVAAMAWENANQDPFLRHAAVMGLVGMNQQEKIRELASDPFPQTALAAVLAMRRTKDPQLARLLHDPVLRMATEAARAINDLQMPEAMPALAPLSAKFAPDERALAAYETADSRPSLQAVAAAVRAGYEQKSKSGVYPLALSGGEAERGRQVVNYHGAAACLRCHFVKGTGGHAAPSLSGVANRYDSAGLLDSLVEPNAQVADGYGPISAMPAMGTLLTPCATRDVVECLTTLKE